MTNMKVNNDDFGLPPVAGEKKDANSALDAALARIALLEGKLAAKIEDESISADEQPSDGSEFPKKYVKLEVFKGRDSQELSYVPVGVNGYVFKITRGEVVIVPTVVVEALDHAVEDVTIQSEGGLVTRPSHRFPYRVVSEATEQEYMAFRAKMREMGKTAALQ